MIDYEFQKKSFLGALALTEYTVMTVINLVIPCTLIASCVGLKFLSLIKQHWHHFFLFVFQNFNYRMSENLKHNYFHGKLKASYATIIKQHN